jgi:hypothetical protein
VDSVEIGAQVEPRAVAESALYESTAERFVSHTWVRRTQERVLRDHQNPSDNIE